ncbi:MFS transporter [Nordella sp. HKS 07]|uniref:MFS transporter n=1 Tax=Nordella sp. HKS 07 TaxID=2712222 RepID=UPI0013E182A2|nr:MFS transporter [Nordella sp. HKS 07]QIG46894.1 MFS transporter [Nordella sp. HKS 07]
MSPRVIRRARGAIATTFLVYGLIVGAWVPHIPLAKDRLAVGNGIFGLALLAIAIGGIIAMPLAAGMTSRFGSAKVTAVTGIALCLAFILPPLAPNLVTFLPAALLFGAALGGMDVAMNAHGVAVEKALRRPSMSFVHAAYSLGALIGTVLGALLLTVIGETSQVLLTTFLGLTLFFACIPFYLPSAVDKGAAGAIFVWPTRASLGLGALCFLTLMSEGAIIDWSGLMLRQRFMIEASTAALGFAAFTTGMTAARLLGDRLRLKIGATRLLRWSALMAAAGLAIALVIPSPVIAIAALAFTGMGLGNAAPILFAGGGRLEPEAPGRGIAAVTTLGYTGFLAGPPFIGLLAELGGLPLALGLVVLASLVIAACARAAGAADSY